MINLQKCQQGRKDLQGGDAQRAGLRLWGAGVGVCEAAWVSAAAPRVDIFDGER